MAPSLWQKWVPKGLCERYKDWESEQPPMIFKGKGVPEMLEAIRQAGQRKATGDEVATGRAVVIPKNSEKCSMIFNCRKQSHADDRKPKGFRLPQVEKIRDRVIFREGKSGWWMCKLDLSNCFWSICLPAQWRHNCKVYVQGGGGLSLPTSIAFGCVRN